LYSASVREREKHRKYDALCDEENISLIPLAVEYFGCWGKEAVCFFEKLCKDVANRFDTSASDVSLQLSRQLAVSLVRSNARAVLRRLSDFV
jgi:hypothetical protein